MFFNGIKTSILLVAILALLITLGCDRDDTSDTITQCTATGNSGRSLRQDYGIISISLKGVSDGETKTKKLHPRV